MFAINHAATAKGFGKPEIGLAVGIGILSHLVLDLITHSRDMAIAPSLMSQIGYGTACWWIYGGSLVLLAVILLFNLTNLPIFVAAIPGAKQKMTNRPLLITSVIFLRIVVTLTLVGLLS